MVGRGRGLVDWIAMSALWSVAYVMAAALDAVAAGP